MSKPRSTHRVNPALVNGGCRARPFTRECILIVRELTRSLLDAPRRKLVANDAFFRTVLLMG